MRHLTDYRLLMDRDDYHYYSKKSHRHIKFKAEYARMMMRIKEPVETFLDFLEKERFYGNLSWVPNNPNDKSEYAHCMTHTYMLKWERGELPEPVGFRKYAVGYEGSPGLVGLEWTSLEERDYMFRVLKGWFEDDEKSIYAARQRKAQAEKDAARSSVAKWLEAHNAKG